MAELTEIPLELQLKEANRCIKIHLSKGRKFQQFLSPMFLRRFLAIMENHISVDWNTISGVYDRMLTLPITLIDTEILDDWFNHPQVWDVSCMTSNTLGMHVGPRPSYAADPVQGSTCHSVWSVLRLRSRLPSTHKPARRPDVPEGCTKEDSVVLVAMPSKPTYSPQPRRGRYLTLLPISGSPDVDRGPLHTFAATGLPVASKEGAWR